MPRRKLTAGYLSYLKSPEWRTLSNACKRRDGFKCILCDARKSLDAHHWRYPRRIEDTTLADLLTICRKHHRTIKRDRADRLPPALLLRRYSFQRKTNKVLA